MTTTRQHRGFQWRAFFSLFVTAAFLALGASGAALFISPAGRIANWSGWGILGVTKAQWQAVHDTFALLFLVAAAVHIFYNWRALLGYVRARTSAGLRWRRELAAAATLGVGLVLGAVTQAPPVRYISDVREALANQWITPATEPPAPHTELRTVAQVASDLKLSPKDALAALRGAGFDAQPDLTLRAVAASHGTTPNRLYAVLAASSPSGAGAPAPVRIADGPGGRILADVAGELGLSTEDAVARLHRAGIEAAPTATLREIASSHGRHAPELLTLLRAQ